MDFSVYYHYVYDRRNRNELVVGQLLTFLQWNSAPMSGFHWSIWEFSVWPLLCFCRRWIEIVLTIALSLKVTIIAFIIKHSDNHREIRQSSSSLSLLRQSTQEIQQKMFVLAHRLFISAISFLFFPHISTKPSPPDSWLRRCFCVTPTPPHFFVPDQLFIWTKTFQKTFF